MTEVWSFHRTVVWITETAAAWACSSLCVKQKQTRDVKFENVQTFIDKPVQNETRRVWPPHYVAVFCERLNIHSHTAYLLQSLIYQVSGQNAPPLQRRDRTGASRVTSGGLSSTTPGPSSSKSQINASVLCANGLKLALISMLKAHI